MNTGRRAPLSGGSLRRTGRKPGIRGKGLRIAIVVSRFNAGVTRKLLAGALECLKANGVTGRDTQVYHCPGAFELPQVANVLCATAVWDAVVCLGAVIRGATPHFEYVSSGAAIGLQNVALRYSCPVSFGVLTTDSAEQAHERAGGRHGNKGWDAAEAAIDMALLFKRVRSRASLQRRRGGGSP